MSINAVICVLSYTHQHFHIKVAPPGSAVSITSTEILSLFYLIVLTIQPMIPLSSTLFTAATRNCFSAFDS